MRFESEQTNTRHLVTQPKEQMHLSWKMFPFRYLSWLIQQAVQNILFVVGLSREFTKSLFIVWILREPFTCISRWFLIRQGGFSVHQFRPRFRSFLCLTRRFWLEFPRLSVLKSINRNLKLFFCSVFPNRLWLTATCVSGRKTKPRNILDLLTYLQKDSNFSSMWEKQSSRHECSLSLLIFRLFYWRKLIDKNVCIILIRHSLECFVIRYPCNTQSSFYAMFF